MADASNAGSSHLLAMDAPPHRISKGLQGSDNFSPLSHQWLSPERGDKKLGIVIGESHFSPHHWNHLDTVKSSGDNVDLHDAGKRGDVFRPPLHDTENGRHDRWHDEERESNSAVRRDRWREGDKEQGDTRRIERWSGRSFRNSGETCRVPSERWNDSGNREGNYDPRRAIKWNGRWGPEDKESENLHERWSDSSKDSEISRNKGMPHLTDREGSHYSRPWRSSSSMTHGRGEPSHPQSLTPNKQYPMSGYVRGRGEDSVSVFSAGRGRVSSSTGNLNDDASRSYNFGTVSDRSGGANGGPLRYSRMKLLDIYRRTNMRSYSVLLDGFAEVTFLTQEEPLEPLALSTASPEELLILKGIDKGDIVSSSMPQVSKDTVPTEQTTLGYREDRPTAGNDYKDENTDSIKAFRSESALKKADVVVTREPSMLEDRMPYHAIPWRSESSDTETGRKNITTVPSSYFKDDQRRQSILGFHSETKSDSMIRRQSSEVLYRDNSSAINIQADPAPENLSLYYKDPLGQIQGPFSGSDLIGWFEAEYFGVDLQVCLASSPADAPFLSLGDVMPHLQTKPRPPPGFGVAKQSNILEASNRENFGSPVKVQAGLGEFELVKNGQRSRHGATTEAENRFLESLMSGNMSSSPLENFSFTEGMQGRGGSGSTVVPSVGGEIGSDVNYLLAQRKLLEPQRSLPDPLSVWSGRDAPSIASKMGLFPCSSTPPSMMLPQMGDTSRQVPQIPQNVDLMSILHATADKSPAPPVNSGVPVWSNFPDVRSQNFTPQLGFGVQQQRLQLQNQPSLPHLINQPGDISSCLIPPEKLLSSEISQDAQLLSFLQQQHLLSQLHMQSQIPAPTQLSLLDKILLLKQQQQQEQQQFLLQQQQQLLSQVFSGYQSQQHVGDPSYGQLHAAFQPGNVPVGSLGFRQVNDSLQIDQQMSVLNLQDRNTSNLPQINLHGPQDFSCSVGSETSPLNVPHQIVENTAYSKVHDGTFSQEKENIPNSNTLAVPKTVESLSSSDAMQKSTQEAFGTQNNHLDLEDCSKLQKPLSVTQPSDIMAPQPSDIMAPHDSEAAVCLVSPGEGSRPSDLVSSNSDQVLEMKMSPQRIPEQSHFESPATKEVKNVEQREVKKSSEKKSRKQKNLKSVLALDLGKESIKTIPCQQPRPDFEALGVNIDGTKSKVKTEAKESPYDTSLAVACEDSFVSIAEAMNTQQAHISSTMDFKNNGVETVEGKGEGREAATLTPNAQATSCHRPWKPAPGLLMAKSLVEIQHEEQQKAQRETMISGFDNMAVPANTPSPTPWLGVTQMEHKPSRDVRTANDIQSIAGYSEDVSSSKSRKGQLGDLLSEEILSKSNEGEAVPLASDNSGSLLPPLPPAGSQVDIVVVDDDFVEAKNSKKSRKKASKAKAAVVKSPSSVGSIDLSSSTIPIEKVKYTRSAQLEKGSSPVPSAGPSFGDFVPWMGDQANSSPALAWSTDLGKLKKPTSLRDIQKEQEKKTPSIQQQIPIPPPSKVQSNQNSRRTASSWQVPGSSPSKGSSPIQTTSLISTQSNSKREDDLFWGPLDQRETKQSGFHVANSSSLGARGTSVKGASGEKSSSSRPAAQARSSIPAPGLSFTKGMRDMATKNTEAMDFRDWCESELVRLTGANDTNFLEFCLKQSTPEAKMLLRENLGSLDRDHEFIDKLLNYKEFLSSEVIELAFRAETSRKATVDGVRSAGSDTTTNRGTTYAGMEMDLKGAAKGGGNKKGKKVKKVSPLVLGFNIVSNRIMKGEIQSVDD